MARLFDQFVSRKSKPFSLKPVLESLEDRYVLDAWGLNLDFGTSTSPVGNGYQQVLLEKYSARTGFGWTDLSGISAVSRSVASSPNQDRAFHTGKDGTFLVDVPNGHYQVTLRFGDPTGTSGKVVGQLENVRFITPATSNGQLVDQTFDVDVSDQQLSLLLQTRATEKPAFAISSMRIVSTDVKPVNQAPTDIALAGTSILENQPAGTLIGLLTTSDPNINDTFTYTLVDGPGATDNSLFSIAEKKLVSLSTLDFEAQSTRSVRIRTTDAGGLSVEKVFTLEVKNLNESPTSLQLSNSVIQSTAAGTLVGLLSTTDPDAGDSFTYSLVAGTGSANNPSFAIQGNSLTTASKLAAGSYSIRLRSTDAGGLFTEKTVVVTVTSSNQAPTDLLLEGTTILENRPVGTVVGKLSTTDPNRGDSFTYTLVNGAGSTDNALFTIAGNKLVTNSVLNYESQTIRSVRIRTTDSGGQSIEKIFSLNVLNVNEAPSSILLSNNLISQATGAGILVGLLSTSDPDAGDTFTYTLVAGTGSANNGSFVVQGNSLKTASALAAGTYNVRIRSTDAGGLFTESTVAITVNSSNQAPTDISLAGSSIQENRPVGSLIGTLSTSDPDAGESFTYTLVAGSGSTDNALFSISGNQLITNSVLNYEAQPTRSLRIRTTDSSGLSYEKTFVISVLDVNEAPTSLSISSSGIQQNMPAGTLVGLLTTRDPDAGDTFTYSLVSGVGSTNNSSFVIQGNSLKTAASLATGSYSVRVRSIDSGGLLTEQAVVIVVSNNTLIVTPEYIQTPYLRMPNFGGEPTLVASQSGNWSDPATWNGRLPQAGDIVSIGSGLTVTYDVASTTMLDVVAIQSGGKLIFRTDVNTSLRVSTLLVMEGGELTVGTTANPVAATVTAQILFPDVPIDTTIDPEQFGHGLIAFGKVTMHGTTRTETFIRLAQEPLAGSNTLRLADPATGWKVGDRLALPDTHQLDYWEQHLYYQNYTPQWEMPTITAISADGKTLTLSAPLQFNHLGNSEFLPHVAAISRNVLVKSENSLGNRGYALFTQRADIDIQFAQFAGLGRTTKDAFDNTTYDTQGNVSHVGTNQQNRYPVSFFHLMGPSQAAGQYQYRFEGNSVVCMMNPFTFRWGIDINDSHYGLINNNVVYNWAGSGIAVESGNETGNVFSNNYVSRVFGTGNRDNEGLDGAGYWFKGPNNVVRDNVATNIRGSGPYSYGFAITSKYLGTVAVPSFHGADMSISNQTTQINMNAISLPEFARNEVYGATNNGLTTWWLGSWSDQPIGNAGTIKDFKVWNVYGWGYFGYESSGLTIDGWTQRGDTHLASGADNWTTVGLFFSDYSQDNLVIKNANIQGVQVGIEAPGQANGTWTVRDSYLKNIVNINIATMWSVSGGEVLPARRTVIDNVQFERYGGNRFYAPQDIQMAFINGSKSNLIQLDTVEVYNYNRVQGDNFRVYYKEQAPDFVVPQTGSNTDGGRPVIGSPDAGLTNLQNWQRYGIAIAGAISPTNTLRPNIFGFVGPI